MAHTFTGTFAYGNHTAVTFYYHFVRVNKVYRDMFRYIVEQACCRVDIERGSYYYKEIEPTKCVNGIAHARNCLSEPDDKWAQL